MVYIKLVLPVSPVTTLTPSGFTLIAVISSLCSLKNFYVLVLGSSIMVIAAAVYTKLLFFKYLILFL